MLSGVLVMNIFIGIVITPRANIAAKNLNVNSTIANIAFFILSSKLKSRGREIRTPDPLVPNQMRYQTALYPDEPF